MWFIFSRKRKNASNVWPPVFFQAPWPVVSSSVPNGVPGTE